VLSTADRAYIRENYVPLTELARDRDLDVAALIADGRLPQPSYVLDDGTEMVPRDYFALLDDAGGVDALHAHFVERYEVAAAREPEQLDPVEDEWMGYLSGGYGVCLQAVTPEAIVRKCALMKRIEALVATPAPDDGRWRDDLRAAVDELDAIERPFAEYDRERFGGPVSRDRLITAVRERYPDVFSAAPVR
jgi:hypothetical protein